MDAMVTARVPVEIRDQVNALLRNEGSSPTELVNAAYDYYLQCGKLPQVSESSDALCITLTPEQAEQIRLRSQLVSHHVPAKFWD